MQDSPGSGGGRTLAARSLPRGIRSRCGRERQGHGRSVVSNPEGAAVRASVTVVSGQPTRQRVPSRVALPHLSASQDVWEPDSLGVPP